MLYVDKSKWVGSFKNELLKDKEHNEHTWTESKASRSSTTVATSSQESVFSGDAASLVSVGKTTFK